MSDWISVKERLPDEDGRDCIVWCDNGEHFIAIMNEGDWYSDEWCIYGVTHWMPMIEGPK